MISKIKSLWKNWDIRETPIGVGSYGTVYEAYTYVGGIKKSAAIKAISISEESPEIRSLRAEGIDINSVLRDTVDELKREVELMESLKSESNIVSIHEYKIVKRTDMLGWDIFIKMELLTPLEKVLASKTFTEDEVIKLGVDICNALYVCGKRNIIHRDVKPANIFVDELGNYKLGDFGIARRMDNLSNGLSRRYTYEYAAPEVLRSSTYDKRVDICSLGVTLYKALNNNLLPFLSKEHKSSGSEREKATNRRINGESIPSPCNASPRLAEVILKACAYNPADRFASAMGFKTALLAVTKKSTPKHSDSSKGGTVKVHGAGKTPSVVHESIKSREKIPWKTIITVILIIAIAFCGIKIGPDVINFFNDDSVINTYSTFDREKIDEIITNAEDLANSGDYANALATIEVGLNTYAESDELKDKKAEYSNKLAEMQDND